MVKQANELARGIYSYSYSYTRREWQEEKEDEDAGERKIDKSKQRD